MKNKTAITTRCGHRGGWKQMELAFVNKPFVC